jgi:hypothetical protein
MRLIKPIPTTSEKMIPSAIAIDGDDKILAHMS